MGLFGLFKGKKKKNDGSAYDPVGAYTSKRADSNAESAFSLFRGDLWKGGAYAGIDAVDSDGIYREEARTPKFDSRDSVVYIGFEDDYGDNWVCRECGAINKKNYCGCVVCGLENK